MKIKYLNKKIKTEIKKWFRSEEDLQAIIKQITARYLINSVIIEDIGYDYDFVKLTLNASNKRNYLISIGLNENIIGVKRLDKNFQDFYYLFGTDTSIFKRVFDIDGNQYLEKIYLNLDKESDYISYQFNYRNNYLDSTIIIQVKQDNLLNDLDLIKAILSKREIKTINDLCKCVMKVLNTNEYFLKIENYKDFEENIVFQNDELLSFKKRVEIDGEVIVLDYHDKTLFETRIVDENNHKSFEEVKKLVIKRRNNEKRK